MANTIFNPHNNPVEELPIIYGFNNGGSIGWIDAVALAEDGTCLGGHICSHEFYIPGDLGVEEGHRPDRHAGQYQKHYPDGYRMEFVPAAEVRSHAKLNAAFALNQEQGRAAEAQSSPASQSPEVSNG